MNPILFLTQALLVIAPPTAGAHEETICFVADTTYNTGNYEYKAIQLLDFIVPPHSTWAPLSTAIRRSSHQLPVSGCVGWLLADAMNPILFFTQALLVIAPPTAGAHEETICFVADTTYNTGNYEYGSTTAPGLHRTATFNLGATIDGHKKIIPPATCQWVRRLAPGGRYEPDPVFHAGTATYRFHRQPVRTRKQYAS
ncbi:hypothetical protein MTO96_001184 [Rhipicephalus appendiculatus]